MQGIAGVFVAFPTGEVKVAGGNRFIASKSPLGEWQVVKIATHAHFRL